MVIRNNRQPTISAFDLALSLALDAAEWLIAHSTGAARAIIERARDALAMAVPQEE
jgi:hypothetical protein